METCRRGRAERRPVGHGPLHTCRAERQADGHADRHADTQTRLTEAVDPVSPKKKERKTNMEMIQQKNSIFLILKTKLIKTNKTITIIITWEPLHLQAQADRLEDRLLTQTTAVGWSQRSEVRGR